MKATKQPRDVRLLYGPSREHDGRREACCAEPVVDEEAGGSRVFFGGSQVSTNFEWEIEWEIRHIEWEIGHIHSKKAKDKSVQRLLRILARFVGSV